MSANYNYELINDYLEGILDEETSKIIRKQLADDASARTIAKGILLLKEQFGTDEAVDDYLNSRLQVMEKTILQSKKSSLVWLKIAASITALAIASFLVYQSSQPGLERLVANHLSEPYELAGTFRTMEKMDLMNTAQLAYTRGEYQEVIELLREEQSSRASFMRGLSYLYTEDYSSAIEALQAAELTQSRYRQQVRWFLTLAHLQLGENDRAQQLLTEMQQDTSSYKKAESKRLIEQLEDN